MKIQIGHWLQNDKKTLDEDRVFFVTDDGRTMFEVGVGTDGHSIEVRGVETCKVDKVLYSDRLMISPNVSNSITVSTKPYYQ